MAPLFGASILPKAPELGRPSSPKRTWVPANVAESMLVTTPPAQRHNLLPVAEAQHQEGKADLQAQAPGNGAPANAPAIGRKQPRRQKNGQNSQNSGESIQEGRSLKNGFQLLAPAFPCGPEEHASRPTARFRLAKPGFEREAVLRLPYSIAEKGLSIFTCEDAADER